MAIVVAVGVVSVPTGVFASGFTEALKEQHDSLRNRSVRKLLLGVMVLVLVVMSLWQLTA